MPFKKGNKLGTGRPKGVSNKYSLEVKEAMADLVSFNLIKLQADLDEMSAKDRAMVILKMSDKVVPNLKSVEMEVTPKGNTSLGFSIDYNEEEE